MASNRINIPSFSFVSCEWEMGGLWLSRPRLSSFHQTYRSWLLVLRKCKQAFIDGCVSKEETAQNEMGSPYCSVLHLEINLPPPTSSVFDGGLIFVFTCGVWNVRNWVWYRVRIQCIYSNSQDTVKDEFNQKLDLKTRELVDNTLSKLKKYWHGTCTSCISKSSCVRPQWCHCMSRMLSVLSVADNKLTAR